MRVSDLTLTSLFLIAATLAGCQSATVERTALESLAPEQINEPLDFFDALEQQPVACLDDLLHGVLILSPDGSPASFEERMEVAQSLGLIASETRLSPRTPITSRQVADVMLRALGAKRTENALAWVQSQWFVRSDVSPDQPVTGGELLAALSRLRDEIAAQAKLGRAPLTKPTLRSVQGGEFLIDLPPLPPKTPVDEQGTVTGVPAGEAQNSPNMP